MISFLFGLYIMDNVLSIRSAFQLSHRLDKLAKLQQEIRQHLDEKGRWIDLMTEASILPVNKRPRIAIRIHTSN